MTYLDDRGEQLNGAHTYTLRLDPTPRSTPSGP